MNKAFLAFASMIITGFILKSYNKLKEKPATKEEVYRAMKKAEYNRRKRDLNALRPSDGLCDAMPMAPSFGYKYDGSLEPKAPIGQASDGCAMMGVAR